MSAKRRPAEGQGLYACQWRLRDKKGVLDPNGHTFCDSQLMTADLLARHVLTQHIPTDSQSPNHSVHQKIACKWSGCFNRHYDAQGLASHLVHDHFTHQMGLKYACIGQRCPIKTTLTSLEALQRHHAIFHADNAQFSKLRPIWQPLRAPTTKMKPAWQQLAALRKLDAKGSIPTKIPVSNSANPKLDPITHSARAMHELDFKRRCFDPFEVRPGHGADGQPWLRFYKRFKKHTEYEESLQAAHDAIMSATTYDQHDLDRLSANRVDCVEIPGDVTLRSVEEGLQTAQLYEAHGSSSYPRKRPRLANTLSLPLEQCEVLVPEHSSEGAGETISSASLASIEREMHFDASLSKQRRWIDDVLKIGPPTAQKGTSTQRSSADSDSYFEEASQDWAPPLRLEPYHPAGRCRFVVAEEKTRQEKPRAIRRRAEPTLASAPSSGHTSTAPSRSSSSSGKTRSSNLSPLPELQFHFVIEYPAPTIGKREYPEDEATPTNGFGTGLPTPTSQIKSEDDAKFYIDLTADSDHEMGSPHMKPSQTPTDGMPSKTPNAAFIELDCNALIESTPSVDRNGADVKAGHCLTSTTEQPNLAKEEPNAMAPASRSTVT